MINGMSAWNGLDDGLRDKFKDILIEVFKEYFENAELERLQKIEAQKDMN